MSFGGVFKRDPNQYMNTRPADGDYAVCNLFTAQIRVYVVGLLFCVCKLFIGTANARWPCHVNVYKDKIIANYIVIACGFFGLGYKLIVLRT